nr:hypothetical protein [uncultured Methanoregula sp.]
MQKNTDTATSNVKKSDEQNESTTLHTCACGEQHEEIPDSPSHRETCTSPKKFGNSCCCGSGEEATAARLRCGHGPRCH